MCARIEAALNRYPGPEITGHPSEKVYQLSPTSRFYPANSTLEIGDQRYPLKTMLAELLTIFVKIRIPLYREQSFAEDFGTMTTRPK